MRLPPENFTQVLVLVVWICLSGALFCSSLLVARGSDLPTRVLALSLTATVIAAIATSMSIILGHSAYITIALTICLIEFLSTLAYARYIQHRRRSRNENNNSLV